MDNNDAIPLVDPCDTAGSHTIVEPEVEIALPKPSHFDIIRFVGSGGFGSVYLARDRFVHKYYAIKVVPKEIVRKKNNVAYMKSEKNIMIKLGYHPFIVFLHYSFQTKKNLYLAMDFLAGGELFFHLRKKGIVVESVARVYFAEMVLAIEHIHNLGIIHRDLKPENVMLNSLGHVSITDFGLAKDLVASNSPNMTTKTVCGTLEYMPPEMLLKVGYGKNVDFWLLGILLYELLVGFSPFSDGNYKDKGGNNTSSKEIERRILHDKVSLPGFLSPNTHSILKELLEKDASKRLGFAKSTMFVIGGMAGLKAHKFFNGLDFHALLAGSIPAPYDMHELHNLIQEQESGGYADQLISSVSPTTPLSDATPSSASSVAEVSGPALASSTLTVNIAAANEKSNIDRVENLITANFANAATSKPISISFLEDCLCNGGITHDSTDRDENISLGGGAACTSTTSTTSDSLLDGSENDKDFSDFDFSIESWYTTNSRLLEIKADIKNKLGKLIKRKKMNAIKTAQENEKAEKLRKEKEKLDAEKQKNKEVERLTKRNNECANLMKSYLQEITTLNAAIDSMKQEEKERLESVDKMSKRLKKINKTLREISEIEEAKKTKKLVPEQKEKLSKKADIEKEKSEVESWLDANGAGDNSNADENEKTVSTAGGTSAPMTAHQLSLLDLQIKSDRLQEKLRALEKERGENNIVINQLKEMIVNGTSSESTFLSVNSSKSSDHDYSFVSVNNGSVNFNSSVLSEDNMSFYTPTNASPQGIYKPPTPLPKPPIPSPYASVSTFLTSSPVPSPKAAASDAAKATAAKSIVVPVDLPVADSNLESDWVEIPKKKGGTQPANKTEPEVPRKKGGKK